MIDNINIDLKKHEQNIDEALNLLENQSYVQRNGDVYEFLTDDEKDIEEEIKNTDIDDQAITNLLKEILFDDIIQVNKIKYNDNKQDYEFTSKIDGVVLGREKELEIEILTENYSDFTNITFIQSQTIASSGMKILLPSNATFMKDLKMYIKTDKYNKQNQSTANKSEVKRILQDKGMQNAERRRNLKLIADNLLASADVFLNGEKIQKSQTSDGKTLVVNAFQNLIKTVYVNLRMLGATQFSEDTFKQVIGGKADDLFKSDDETMSEAESEILTIINRRKGQSDRTTLNDLKTIFAKKPYGWYQNAVWTIVAKLYKRGKIEIKKDSNVLDDMDVIQALLNSASFANTLLEPQAVIDAKLVKDLKAVYAEAFDENCSLNDAKDVANAFKEKLKAMNGDLAQLMVRKSELPFMSSLNEFKELVDKLCKKEYTYFLTNIKDFEDDLLDTKENLLDPIKRFINGDQLKIYESIRTMVKSDVSNFEYVEGNEFNILKELLNNPMPYNGNSIKEAKTAQDELTSKVLARILEEKTKAISATQKAIDDIKSKEEFMKLNDANQILIIAPFEEIIGKLREQRYIAVIRDTKTKTLESLFPRQLNEMIRLGTPIEEDGDVVNDPVPHYISRTSIKVDFGKTELRTEADVDDYLEALKKAMLKQISENRRISL